MPPLAFAKMQALGNDFVVFDGRHQAPVLTPERIRFLADRRLGVGCDQVLIVESHQGRGADFTYRIYNADGGEAAHCGNGVRCLALFIREMGLSDKSVLTLTGRGGVVRTVLESKERIGVDMGIPQLEGEAIPLSEAGEWIRRPVTVEGDDWPITVVSMGNPHCVIEVPVAEEAPVASLGSCLEHHGLFPYRTNVEFVQVEATDRLRVRVWERGVGITPACGTGACAAQVAARLWERSAETATVILDGGTLSVRWAGLGEPVHMTGPAELVYWGDLPSWPEASTRPV